MSSDRKCCLALTRRARQSILIGEDIEVEVVRVMPGKVLLAIHAPDSVTIVRRELAGRSGKAQP